MLWNHPKRLEPFQKTLASIAALVVLVGYIVGASWIPFSASIIIVIYVVGFVIYLSMPWESWEWTAKDDQSKTDLRRLFRYAHNVMILGVLLSVVLCVASAFATQYLPTATNHAVETACGNFGTASAHSNCCADATLVVTNTGSFTNAMVGGSAKGQNVTLMPVHKIVEYLLEPVTPMVVKFSGGLALLIGALTVVLLWLEKLVRVLHEKKA